MGVVDLSSSSHDYRLPSLLPAARESRFYSYEQQTADAQSYANIIAYLRANQETAGGGGGGGGRTERMTIDNNNRATRNNDNNNSGNRNYDNNRLTMNSNNNERKQNFDSMPAFPLEELSEADIDNEALIDNFFRQHHFSSFSPMMMQPLQQSIPSSNSGPIRHQRTRGPAGFTLPSSSSSSASDNNNNNNNNHYYENAIEEELPLEFHQPPASSPQPLIDYLEMPLLDGLQEYTAA